MARVSERIAKVMSTIWNGIRDRVPREEVEKFKFSTRFIFCPLSGQACVWVDALEFSPRSQNMGAMLKSYRITLRPPGGDPCWSWGVNEFAENDEVKYEPLLLGYDQLPDAERKGIVALELRSLKDPSVKEMEEAAQLLEECWKEFGSGEDTITYWPGRKSGT